MTVQINKVIVYAAQRAVEILIDAEKEENKEKNNIRNRR
jgi:hypothetical protein